MVLVSNLALGDTMICVYSVAIASVIISYPYFDYVRLLDSMCPKVGFLWVLGYSTPSITSLALTVKRYLCIVFSMKPDIRMTPRLTSLAIANNWLLGASSMVIVHHLKLYRKNYICLPISFDRHFSLEARLTIAQGTTGIFLYLLTIPLYIHIYVVVKRSSQQMGVKRESALAKRIALLVASNLVFFFISVFLLGAWMLFQSFQNKSLLYISKVIVQQLASLYCLSINTCLNPLVHAFRNDKFKPLSKRTFY